MTPPAGGKARRRNRSQAVLRGFGMVSSLGLGAFSLWLIVTAETVKGTRIGALIGFWALLIAAFAVFGTRHPIPALTPVADRAPPPGGELARVDDAAARREYEYRLMEMLRREITATMSSELVTLRADVSALRSELVEKVGGQIRLERIETTRVIGSDIEALQHEVRQLMMGGRQLGSFSVGSSHTSLITPSEFLHTEPLPAEEFMTEPLRPQPAAPPSPEPIAPQPSPEPITPEPPVVPKPGPPVPTPPAPTPPAPTPPIEPVPVPPQAPEQAVRPGVAEPDLVGDPFASMPRLRPFTDFELDPIDVEPEPDDSYTGRRRQNGAADPINSTGEPAAPEHARTQDARDDSQSAPASGGGRRRRAVDGDDDDVLARILSREASR